MGERFSVSLINHCKQLLYIQPLNGLWLHENVLQCTRRNTFCAVISLAVSSPPLPLISSINTAVKTGQTF